MQIVRDADGLPPNPKYVDTELFRRPPDYPNEWGCHEAYANAAKTIAIVQSFSPFVLPVVALRYDWKALDQVMNDRATPQEAANEAAERVNEEIQRTLKESAELRQKFEELTALQKKIDQHRKEGKTVPVEWLKNPFYQRYYVYKGWSE
jgi:hypothetical protein